MWSLFGALPFFTPGYSGFVMGFDGVVLRLLFNTVQASPVLDHVECVCLCVMGVSGTGQRGVASPPH